MNYLRGLVSAHKHMYQHNGDALDLTYITPRIIAMGLPSTCFEKCYRNDIRSVKELLH